MKTMHVTVLGSATLESYLDTRRMLLRKADELSVRISKLEPVKSLEAMNQILDMDKDRQLFIEIGGLRIKRKPFNLEVITWPAKKCAWTRIFGSESFVWKQRSIR